MRGRTVNGTPGAAQLRRAYAQKLNNRRLRALQQAQAASARVGAAAGSTAPQAGAAAQSAAILPPSNGVAWTPVPSGIAAIRTDSGQDYGLVVGRATSVLVDQSDSTGNTVYLGGASGGLWRSTNAAASDPTQVLWTPLTDDQATLAVGAIALQPGNSNLIVVGTGEANNSADSYYGQGFLVSSNAQATQPTWTLVDHATVKGVSQPLQGLGITHIAFSTDNPSVVVAAAAAASGGIQVGAESGGGNLRGLYYSVNAGSSWAYATVNDPSGPVDPGSTTAVIYNPVVKKFYAAYRYHGFYSSSDGQNWTRLACQPGDTVSNGVCTANSGTLNATACPAVLSRNPTTGAITTVCPLYRAELAIVRDKNVAGGYRNEMYTWMVNSGSKDIGMFQSLDGGATWTAVDTSSTSGLANCGDGSGCDTAQGTYNLTLAAVPNGQATDLYAGAINEYKCTLTGTPPNAGTCSFVNLTHVYGCSPTASISHVHPDEHGIDYSSANPQIVYFAHDGGVSRTLNSFSTQTATCSGATNPQPQITVPFDNLDGNMGSLLQFVSFSQHPTDDTTLLGGTQDNGSPAVSSTSPSNGNLVQVNNGDGGFNDINPNAAPDLTPAGKEWFTTNSRLPIQRCALGIGCTPTAFSPVITQSSVSGDNSPFYTMYRLDPQASSRMIVGTCRIWRGNSNGINGTVAEWGTAGAPGTSGSPLSNPFDNSFSTGQGSCATSAMMVNALDAGGPTTSNGSQVIWAGMEGTPADLPNGIPASGGQVWMTANADGGPATWVRVDGGGLASCTATASPCNINPKSYNISDIAVDRTVATGKTAYVTIMGFGTPHLLKTTDGGSTWAVLDGDPNNLGLPDAPADAVTIDPINPSTVYVASDVGVFAYSNASNTWTELGTSNTGSGAQGTLPNVATTRLRVFNSAGTVKLRVSTYGRGIWETALSPDFNITVSNPVQTVFPGQTATFSGTLTLFYNYNSAITISCAGTTLPSTCTGTSIASPQNGQSFTVTASNASIADFNFSIQAVGQDGKTHSVPATLHVADFSLGTPSQSSLTIGHSASGSVTVPLTPVGTFTGLVTFSCSGLPAGMTCSFPSGSTVSGASPTSVQVQINVDDTVPLNTYTITIGGTSGGVTHTQTVSVTVQNNPTFFVTNPTPASGSVKASASFSGTVTVTSQDNFSGTVNLACNSDSLGACTLSASAVSTFPANVTVTIPTTAAMSGTHNPSVTGSSGSINQSASFQVTVQNFTVAATNATTVPSSSANLTVTVTPQSGYVGSVVVTCQALGALPCPPGSQTVNPSAGAQPVTESIAVPQNQAAGAYTFNFTGTDSQTSALFHVATATVTVTDFTLSVAAPTSITVKAGATPNPSFVITVTPQSGFTGTLNFTSANCPTIPPSSCSFSPSSLTLAGTAQTTTLTVATIAPTVAQAQPPPRRPGGAPLYALWLSLPGIALGWVSLGRTTKGRRVGWLGLGLLVGVLLLQMACGGGGGGGTTPPPPTPVPGTPAGTYNIMVTATSTSPARMQTTQVTVVVQ